MKSDSLIDAPGNATPNDLEFETILSSLDAIEDEREEAKRKLYLEWQSKVYLPLKRSLSECATDAYAFHRTRRKGGSIIAHRNRKVTINSSMDPLKRQQYEDAKEQRVRGRTMQRDPPPTFGSPDRLEPSSWSRGITIPVRLLRPDDTTEPLRGHKKPKWDGEYYPAGLRRFKSMGIYSGSVATRGQAAEFGRWCAAPCQDHYDFPKDRQSVDSEFPRGKRTFTLPAYMRKNPLLLV